MGGLALIALAANGCFKETEAPKQFIRRETGVWTQADVEALANQMIAETRYFWISSAGVILLDNQQGQPSFSKVSDMFEDDKPIQFETIKEVQPSPYAKNSKAPMASSISQNNNDKVEIVLKSKTDGSLFKFPGEYPSSLSFESLEIDRGAMDNVSDFIFKLYIAKEIYNAKSFDLVAEFLASEYYEKYEKPEDDLTKRAVKVAMMDSDIGDFKMPTAFAADMWAHYMVLPDYLMAKNDGKFTKKEIESIDLAVFDLTAGVFQEDGVLIANSDGTYGWTQDSNKFYSEWFNFTAAWYKALN